MVRAFGLLLLALVVAATAGAGAQEAAAPTWPDLDLVLEDDAGDARRHDGGPARGGLDLVRFESRVEGHEVVQRVTFADTDWWAGDTLTFFIELSDGTMDEDVRVLEVVHTFEQDRYHAYGSLREGPRSSAGPIRAETSLDNGSVVLRLDLAAFEGATCFDPTLRMENGHVPRRGEPDVSGFDALARDEPTCKVGWREPGSSSAPFEHPPVVGYRMPENPPTDVLPPGTRAPTPLPAAPLVLAFAVAALCARRG